MGHILRMDSGRKLKQTVFEMYKDRSEGDMLMDVPEANTWRELTKKYVWDKNTDRQECGH